jgi:hypothetical protein
MSHRLHISAICPLLLLATIAGCTWPGGPWDRDTVDLHFDWPVGLTAFVQTERSTRVTGAHGPTSTTLRMSYRLDVEEAENGRLIRYSDIRAEDPASGRSYAMGELPEPMENQLIAQFPSFVVSDEGQLVQLEGIESLIEETRRKLESRLADLPFESAEARELVAASVTEEGLLAATREHWQQLVGGWSGASLVVGESYRREDQLAVPRAPLRIRSTVEFGVGGRIPCGEELTAADCVEIEVRSRPLPEALAQLEEVMRERSRALTRESVEVLENLEIEESSYLVTEPSTLIPHYLETTTKFQATIRRPGDAERVIADLDQSVHRYTYAAPPQTGHEATR